MAANSQIIIRLQNSFKTPSKQTSINLGGSLEFEKLKQLREQNRQATISPIRTYKTQASMKENYLEYRNIKENNKEDNLMKTYVPKKIDKYYERRITSNHENKIHLKEYNKASFMNKIDKNCQVNLNCESDKALILKLKNKVEKWKNRGNEILKNLENIKMDNVKLISELSLKESKIQQLSLANEEVMKEIQNLNLKLENVETMQSSLHEKEETQNNILEEFKRYKEEKSKETSDCKIEIEKLKSKVRALTQESIEYEDLYSKKLEEFSKKLKSNIVEMSNKDEEILNLKRTINKFEAVKETSCNIMNFQTNNDLEDFQKETSLKESQLNEKFILLEEEIFRLSENREIQLSKINNFENIFKKLDSKAELIFCLIVDKNNEKYSKFGILNIEEKLDYIYNEIQSQKVIFDYKISSKENNLNTRKAINNDNVNKIKNKALMVLNERCQNTNSNYFKRAKSNAPFMSTCVEKNENIKNSTSQINYLNEIRQKLVGIDRALSKGKKEGFLKPYKSLKID